MQCLDHKCGDEFDEASDISHTCYSECTDVTVLSVCVCTDATVVSVCVCTDATVVSVCVCTDATVVSVCVCTDVTVLSVCVCMQDDAILSRRNLSSLLQEAEAEREQLEHRVEQLLRTLSDTEHGR